MVFRKIEQRLEPGTAHWLHGRFQWQDVARFDDVCDVQQFDVADLALFFDAALQCQKRGDLDQPILLDLDVFIAQHVVSVFSDDRNGIADLCRTSFHWPLAMALVHFHESVAARFRQFGGFHTRTQFDDRC